MLSIKTIIVAIAACSSVQGLAGTYEYHELETGAPTPNCKDDTTTQGWVYNKEVVIEESDGTFTVTPDVCGTVPFKADWAVSGDKESLTKTCNGEVVTISHVEADGHEHLEVDIAASTCVHELEAKEKGHAHGAWLYGTLGAAITCMASLVGAGVMLLPCVNITKLIRPMLALAAGSLLGTSAFVLIPEAVEIKGFSVGTGAILLLGVFVGYILENLLHAHAHTKQKAAVKVAGEASEKKKKGILSTTALLSLVGDFFHSFVDGALIGATFLVNTSTGFSTTLAVILHELPQEMGDFCILLDAGVSKRGAVCFNFLASLSAFLGCWITIGVGSQFSNSTASILPFAAGLFFYLSLTCLIPELTGEHLHTVPHKEDDCGPARTVAPKTKADKDVELAEKNEGATSQDKHKHSHGAPSRKYQLMIIGLVLVGAGMMALISVLTPHSHDHDTEGGGHDDHDH